MKTIVDVGETTLTAHGGGIIMRAPLEWLSKYGLEIGTPVFSIPTLAGEIRWHLTQVPWSRKAKIRLVNGHGWLAVNRDNARRLGLWKDDVVRLSVDTVHGILIMRKAGPE